MIKRFLGAFALIAALGSLTTAQRAQTFPPGFVDPKPVLDAAVRAIGADKMKCITVSGTAYAGALGQQFESDKNVDWPRGEPLANYTRTMNWDAKTMREEFDRKPGMNPASYKFGVGWVDGPLQMNQHQRSAEAEAGRRPDRADPRQAGAVGRFRAAGEQNQLVSRPGDSRHQSRSAAPGWQGAKSERIGHT